MTPIPEWRYSVDGNPIFFQFIDLKLRRDYRFETQRKWSSDVRLDSYTGLPEPRDKQPRYADVDKETSAVIYEFGDALCYLGRYRGDYTLDIAASNPSTIDGLAHELWAEFLAVIPAQTRTDGTQPVRFWNYNPQNGSGASATRQLKINHWGDVADNYPGKVQKQLAGLMTIEKPVGKGQLLLWHGEPGTGKTHAIRALCREWRTWCKAHYIIDPSRFLGEARYMTDVLVETDEPRYDYGEDETGDSWQLLIIEDAGELLSEDARVRSGERLSALLNIVDGFIGQGLNVLVLITTNEPIKRLHPALSRPGRCMADIEFVKLDATEAALWLASHDVPHGMAKAATLAELYARSSGVAVTERNLVGFTT